MEATMHANKRRRLQRRAQHVLLCGLAVILLVQLTGGLLLDHIWPEIRFPQAAYRLEEFRDRTPSPYVLCFGTSRFEGGVQPAVIGPLLHQAGFADFQVCNASVGGGDLIVADHVVTQCLREGHRPSLLVLEVSPETVARYNDWIELHVLRQFNWADMLRYLPDICRARHPLRVLSARFLPLYVHRHRLCKRVGCSLLGPEFASSAAGAATTTGQEGAAAIQSMEAQLLTEQERRLQISRVGATGVRRWLQDYQVGGGSGKALERLLCDCRQQRIPVILVGVPVSSPHRETYTPDIDSAFLRYMQHLTATYGCSFVDFRGRLPDRLFADCHHVNPKGAIRFSKLLAREVLIPALGTQGSTLSPLSP